MLRFVLCIGSATAVCAASPALVQYAPASPATRRYDIPPQNLEAALLKLGQLSGIDILYERDVLAGLRSAPVSGELTPQVAVARILAGTRLRHRFTTPTAVLILPARPAEATGGTAAIEGAAGSRLVLDRLQVRTERVIGHRPQPDYGVFGQLVRVAIAKRLQDHPSTRSQVFSVRLAVTIDAQGRIRDLLVRGGPGRHLERQIISALADTTLPDPPPATMPQPIWLEIDAR